MKVVWLTECLPGDVWTVIGKSPDHCFEKKSPNSNFVLALFTQAQEFK